MFHCPTTLFWYVKHVNFLIFRKMRGNLCAWHRTHTMTIYKICCPFHETLSRNHRLFKWSSRLLNLTSFTLQELLSTPPRGSCKAHPNLVSKAYGSLSWFTPARTSRGINNSAQSMLSNSCTYRKPVRLGDGKSAKSGYFDKTRSLGGAKAGTSFATRTPLSFITSLPSTGLTAKETNSVMNSSRPLAVVSPYTVLLSLSLNSATKSIDTNIRVPRLFNRSLYGYHQQ